MAYVDAFLIPVPTDRKEDYRAHEAKWWPFFQGKGATALVVCWGDDVPAGTVTDFQRAVALQPGETVVVAWMIWPDRAVHDKAAAEMQPDMMDASDMPFDGKRLVYGGFSPILSFGSDIPA